jgi:site-specific DNA recombinase
VVGVYKDAEASGASLHGRPGIARLLAGTEAQGGRHFDVVLTEATSRIGRDQEDRAHVRKRLAFAAIGIETPAKVRCIRSSTACAR